MGVVYPMYEKSLNPRECIEETILYFNPTISDKELLDLREHLFLNVFQKTRPITGTAQVYSRDYHLYTRNKTL